MSGTRPWSDVMDEVFGPPGSPEREAVEAGARALARRDRAATRLTRWLRAFGPVGHIASTFWYYVLTERNPRDGLEWMYLNDAVGRPQLWYLWDVARGLDMPLYPGQLPERRPDAA